MKYDSDLVRIEISKDALLHNIQQLKKNLAPQTAFAAVIKANAYGHGLLETAEIIAPHVDWFMVHCIDEAIALRNANYEKPILVLSYVQASEQELAILQNIDLSVSDMETAKSIAAIAEASEQHARLHLKLETGTHRQGAMPEDFLPLARYIANSPNCQLFGLYTHFANIEDTTVHDFAKQQLARFVEAKSILKNEVDIQKVMFHTACSAAAILFPQTHLDLARIGISLYGLWPSKETMVSASSTNQKALQLKPVMSAKTKIAQIKTIPQGAYIGYGCTYRTTRPTKIAILPIGYFDGYDRLMGNMAYVLIKGQRAPVRGRISMNLTVVDITDISDVQREDEVVLLGTQQDEQISAEQLAAWSDTINYEIVTRMAPHAPRIVV